MLYNIHYKVVKCERMTVTLAHTYCIAYRLSTDTCSVMAMGAIAGCSADQAGTLLLRPVKQTQLRCTKAHATDGVAP
jgi:hypothetical protein